MNTKLRQLLEQEGVGSIMSDAALEAVNTLTSIEAENVVTIKEPEKEKAPAPAMPETEVAPETKQDNEVERLLKNKLALENLLGIIGEDDSEVEAIKKKIKAYDLAIKMKKPKSGKMEEGGNLQLGPQIIYASTKNPLSKQLMRLTGDTWSTDSFEPVGEEETLTSEKPFRHKSTGKTFVAVFDEEMSAIPGDSSEQKYEDGGEVPEKRQLHPYQEDAANKDITKERESLINAAFANKDIEITQFNKYGYPGEWVSKDGRLSVTRTALKTEFGFTDMYTLTIDGEKLFTTDNKLIVANATLDYLSGKTEGLLLNKKSAEEPESPQNPKEEMDIEKIALDAMDKYENTMEKLGNYEKVEKLKKNLAALETLKETLGEDADAEELSTINKKIAAYKLSIKMEKKKIVPEKSKPIEEDSQDISNIEENKDEESNSIGQALSVTGMDSEKIPSAVSFLQNAIRRNPGIANMVDR
jgi:hypothetical protein